MPSQYSDEQLLALSHLGEAVVGPELRAEIVACQARTKAQDANSTVLGPAILGYPESESEPKKSSRAKKAV